MKKTIIIVLSILLSGLAYWQIDQERSPKDRVNSFVFGEKESHTFEEMRQEELKKKIERRARGEAKKDKPEEFVKFYNAITVRPGEDAVRYPDNYRLDELNKAKHKVAMKSSTLPLDWKERGPGNVSGRTRAVIIDPDDASCDTWFAGSVSGGIWKTTDAAQSWTNLTPNLPNLAIASMAMAASNTQVIYAGTGEGFFNADAVRGDGIFKSTDKGASWQQLSSTASNSDFHYVNRMVVDPLDANTLIAATNTSLQKSTDGGQVWRNVFSDDARVQQVILATNNLDTLYATVHHKGIIKSTDRGETWDYCLETSLSRLEMAVSPTHPNMLYAIEENDEIHISEDYGKTWYTSIIVYGNSASILGGQGWYNMAMAVVPADPQQVVIGGITLRGLQILGDSLYQESQVDTFETASYMRFINHNNADFGGAAFVNEEYYNGTQIEIQFGPSKSQKAHRFTVPEGATAGVSAVNYTYQDYVDVPFEVWDVENNRQLMVSFRDQSRDGVFDLTALDNDLAQGREYLWINDVAYSADGPDVNIALNGGQEYRHIFYTWPVLQDGAVWDAQNLPSSKIIISSVDVKAKKLAAEKISYAYTQEGDEPYIHPDMHNIQFGMKADGSARVLVAHDGGIAYSDDYGQTWSNPESGYNTTQFYGVDKKAGEDRYVGGAQDNGSWISLSDPDAASVWLEASGGDGFDAVWHPYTGELITSWQWNNMVKIASDLQSYSYLDNVPDVGDGASFFTQIGYHPSAPNNLFLVGPSGVAYSKDFGDTWHLAEMSDSLWGWRYSGFVEPSLVSPDVVWASSGMDYNSHVMLSKDGGQSFVSAGNIDSTSMTISGLATHPTNEKSAFVLFSYPEQAKILRTTNFGQTWEDISGFEDGESTNGFPDVAVYCLLVMPHDTSIIWVGTEIGLFISEDNGASWNYSNNGLPAVSIWEMKIRDQQVVLATHGRGIWTVDVPEIPVTIAPPFFMDAKLTPTNKLWIKYVQQDACDSIVLRVDSADYIKVEGSFSSSEEQSKVINYTIEGMAHVLQLIAYKDGQSYKSSIFPIEVLPYNVAQESYVNNFDVVDNDFYGIGMSVQDQGDLEASMALHSEHPYGTNQEIMAMLRTPIILNDAGEGRTTKLKYSDIPMIEEGEDGSVFGAEDFDDYVVAIGSTDGNNWVPLGTGYDFREVKEKATTLGLTVDSVPTSQMFIDHEIDLLNTFDAGDTILIAFYLYSDPASVGWGWVIDNVEIGMENPTSTTLKERRDVTIYPMPCSSHLNVKLETVRGAKNKVSVYNMNGALVKQESYEGEEFSISTVDLKPSNYILMIHSDDVSCSRKFVVLR